MGATDPARAKKRTRAEHRKIAQDGCKESPCFSVRKGQFPPCVVCVHEGIVRKGEPWRP